MEEWHFGGTVQPVLARKHGRKNDDDDDDDDDGRKHTRQIHTLATIHQKLLQELHGHIHKSELCMLNRSTVHLKNWYFICISNDAVCSKEVPFGVSSTPLHLLGSYSPKTPKLGPGIGNPTLNKTTNNLETVRAILTQLSSIDAVRRTPTNHISQNNRKWILGALTPKNSFRGEIKPKLRRSTTFEPLDRFSRAKAWRIQLDEKNKLVPRKMFGLQI
jgi:hypothetical protein